jgi:hypothetical protein
LSKELAPNRKMNNTQSESVLKLEENLRQDSKILSATYYKIKEIPYCNMEKQIGMYFLEKYLQITILTIVFPFS